MVFQFALVEDSWKNWTEWLERGKEKNSFYFKFSSAVNWKRIFHLHPAQVVRKVNKVIHYPADSMVWVVNTYPLVSDLSSEYGSVI